MFYNQSLLGIVNKFKTRKFDHIGEKIHIVALDFMCGCFLWNSLIVVLEMHSVVYTTIFRDVESKQGDK